MNRHKTIEQMVWVLNVTSKINKKGKKIEYLVRVNGPSEEENDPKMHMEWRMLGEAKEEVEEVEEVEEERGSVMDHEEEMERWLACFNETTILHNASTLGESAPLRWHGLEPM